jgi:hypothetical protein
MEDIFLDETLCNFLEANHTSPVLANTLLEELYCNLHESRYPKFRNRHGANDPKYHKLHQRQAYVGWSQLFQGRLVKDWSELQEEVLDNHNAELKLDRRYHSGTIWARKLVNLLWGIMRTQWDHRNADRHGRTKEDNHEIRHARLLHQLTEQYAEAPVMLAADHDLLAEPINAKQKKSPAALELWMKRVRPIVKLSTHEATEAINAPINKSPSSLTEETRSTPKITKKARRSLDRSKAHTTSTRATPQCLVAKGSVCPSQRK